LGVKKIKGLILSHQDSGHSSAATVLEKDFSLQALYYSAQDPIELDTIKGSSLSLGHSAPNTDSLKWEVLYPKTSGPSTDRSDDRCLILKLKHRSISILFHSDAGFNSEKWLLENSPEKLSADVLILGNHRDDQSGLPQFIRAVNPSLIIQSNDQFPVEDHQGATSLV